MAEKQSKRFVCLKTVRHINQFLRRIINQRNRNEMDSEKARDLGYLCKILIDAMEIAELENKLWELERQLNEMKLPAGQKNAKVIKMRGRKSPK